MNVGGGEAADQLVRMMLSGGEVAVRLSGSALKNLLALTVALAHNRKTLSGKVNMGKMLRETRDLRRFPMTPKQFKQFRKLAQKHKLPYSVIRDKDDRGKVLDVILPVTKLDRAIETLTREILTDLVDHIKVYENGNISVHFKFADEFRKIAEYIEINTTDTAEAG